MQCNQMLFTTKISNYKQETVRRVISRQRKQSWKKIFYHDNEKTKLASSTNYNTSLLTLWNVVHVWQMLLCQKPRHQWCHQWRQQLLPHNCNWDKLRPCPFESLILQWCWLCFMASILTIKHPIWWKQNASVSLNTVIQLPRKFWLNYGNII